MPHAAHHITHTAPITPRWLCRRFLFVACLLAESSAVFADIILTSSLPTYSQNFDSLAASGTSSTLPDGWFLLESGASANSTYTAGTGSGTTGDTYSFGASGNPERALGGQRTGSLVPEFGVQLKVGGPSILESLQVAYTGEQWRMGAAGRMDRLDFQYSLDATSLNTGLWTDFDSLDFTAPVTTGPVGAVNGNLLTSQTALSATLSGLNVSSGSSVWFRWRDLDASGFDDGLAVDQFSVTGSFQAAAVPEPGSAIFLAVAAGCGAVLRSGFRGYLSGFRRFGPA